jgi:hypothetical protein
MRMPWFPVPPGVWGVTLAGFASLKSLRFRLKMLSFRRNARF